MFNGEIIFHKKDTEKVVFSTSERLDNDIKSSSGLKNLFVHFYHAPNILLWGTKYCARKQLCNNTLYRRNELKVLISPPGRPVPCQWWKINVHSLQIAKASFKYPQVLCFFIVVHPSTKSKASWLCTCTRFYSPFSPGLMVFIDMSMCRCIYLQKAGISEHS